MKAATIAKKMISMKAKLSDMVLDRAEPGETRHHAVPSGAR
jgi:hypothetical protein